MDNVKNFGGEMWKVDRLSEDEVVWRRVRDGVKVKVERKEFEEGCEGMRVMLLESGNCDGCREKSEMEKGEMCYEVMDGVMEGLVLGKVMEMFVN